MTGGIWKHRSFPSPWSMHSTNISFVSITQEAFGVWGRIKTQFSRSLCVTKCVNRCWRLCWDWGWWHRAQLNILEKSWGVRELTGREKMTMTESLKGWHCLYFGNMGFLHSLCQALWHDKLVKKASCKQAKRGQNTESALTREGVLLLGLKGHFLAQIFLLSESRVFLC